MEPSVRKAIALSVEPFSPYLEWYFLTAVTKESDVPTSKMAPPRKTPTASAAILTRWYS